MKKVTKAIKLVSGLTDEEKQEFAEFFKQEEEEVETKVEEKEEVKKEVKKEEPKKEEKVDFESKFNELLEITTGLAKEVKDLKEKQPKLDSFGAKQKQGEGKETNDFNDLFNKLTQTQR